MSETKQKIDLNQFSKEELNEFLKRKEAEEIEAHRKKRAAYEQKRDHKVNRMVDSAVHLHEIMCNFKKECLDFFEQTREDAMQYGDIRSNSKGGFSLRASDTGNLARLARNTKMEYDERADLAIDLLNEFLDDKVKKRDLGDYRAIKTLLSKNHKGELHPAKVGSLISIEDNYTDERWRKAINLLKEALVVRDISMSIEFSRPDKTGKDQPVKLNFVSINVDDLDEAEGSDREQKTEEA